METGPLARVLMMYAGGHEPTRTSLTKHWHNWPAARSDVLDDGPHRSARTGVQNPRRFHAAVVRQPNGNIKTGDVRTFNQALWEPATWPRHAQGVGFVEAPRGSLAHWIVIDDDRISNYQAVVPTTWNAGPRCLRYRRPYEAALKGHSLLDPKQPWRSCARSIASIPVSPAVHVVDPDGEELIQVRVQ